MDVLSARNIVAPGAAAIDLGLPVAGAEIDALWNAAFPTSVSLYVPTEPASSGEAEQIAFKNLGRAALDQLAVGRAAVRQAAHAGGDVPADRIRARARPGRVRLLETVPDAPPALVRVPDMPSDVASAADKAPIKDRAPIRRLQGDAGQKVRIRQYARRAGWLSGARLLAVSRGDVPGGGDLAAVLRYTT